VVGEGRGGGLPYVGGQGWMTYLPGLIAHNARMTVNWVKVKVKAYILL